MANNTYNVNQLVPGSATVTVTDDGTGNDWLVITATPTGSTSIDLGYTNNASGNATQASGFYFTSDNVGHRLIVNGTIENVRGSNGVDEIQGNEVGNILYGDQAATGAGLGDTIDADRGNDTVYGGSGNDTITGDLGSDRLFGDSGDDSISGGDGIDTVYGGLGRDNLDGGADRSDTVDYSTSNAGVVIKITFGVTTTGSGGHAAGDRIYGFTNVTGSAHADTISDTDKGTLAFGYNDNTFSGGNGNDRLDLGGGNDKGYGGSGNDKVFGEDGNDQLYGDGNADSLYGGRGKDTLDGGDGADRFIFSTTAGILGRCCRPRQDHGFQRLRQGRRQDQPFGHRCKVRNLGERCLLVHRR